MERSLTQELSNVFGFLPADDLIKLIGSIDFEINCIDDSLRRGTDIPRERLVYYRNIAARILRETLEKTLGERE